MTDFKWTRAWETERQESRCGQITARLSTAAATIPRFDVLRAYLDDNLPRKDKEKEGAIRKSWWDKEKSGS